MAERSWEYLLPTGEKLETRLDEGARIESVYLGPRLVSRSTVGGKPGGHTIAIMHGDAAGPFRGGSSARVAFVVDAAGPRCEVTIDDRHLEPSIVPPVAQPPDVPPDAVAVAPPRTSNRLLAGLVLATLGLVIAAALGRASYRHAANGELPLVNAARTPNGMVRIHYSTDFRPAVEELRVTPAEALQIGSRKVQPTDAQNVVTLTREPRGGGIVIVTIPHVSSADAMVLDDELKHGPNEPLAREGATVHDVVRSPDKCLGQLGVVAVRDARTDDASYRVWSCTFVRGERGYHFVTYLPDGIKGDQPLLRRIVDATDLL